MTASIPHWLIIVGGVGQLFTAMIYPQKATFYRWWIWDEHPFYAFRSCFFLVSDL